MIRLIDSTLNRITMYRLVLYYLSALWVEALILSFFALVPFTPSALIFSTAVIVIVSLATNSIFARVFHVPVNHESVYITALILVLIVSPSLTQSGFLLYGWVSVLAMASKYILAVYKKHFFNPAAFAVIVTALALGQAASWWIGNQYMMPVVLIGGLLMVRKMSRFDLVLSFFVAAAVSVLGAVALQGGDIVSSLLITIERSSLLFLGFVMLTEPLTSPPTRTLRIVYGAMVGFLFAPWVHAGTLYSTPELALIVGNIFAYIASPKHKLVLRLQEKIELAPGVFDFVFKPHRRMRFDPGQYLEWTLGGVRADSRGNRRYFTIASAPTEDEIRMGVRFSREGSAFKETLASLRVGDMIVAGSLAGDFTMPADRNKKLVFIAGGIGVTPFRSMVKTLIDTQDRRHVTLLYSNRTPEDIVYKDIFDRAAREIGMKTVYTVTDPKVSPAWMGNRGVFTEDTIQKEVPDYAESMFFLSGPRSMVTAFEDALTGLGVARSHIKTDFFPGFA